jgi:hypothetical protein
MIVDASKGLISIPNLLGGGFHMQLRKKHSQLKKSIVLTLLISVAACGNSSGSSANPDSNNSSSAGSGYEVVTVTKPENLAQYRDWYKNGYDACVGFAQIKICQSSRLLIFQLISLSIKIHTSAMEKIIRIQRSVTSSRSI